MRGPPCASVLQGLLVMWMTFRKGVFGQNNVAVGRPALQSSNYSPTIFLAREGSDGIQGSCTHTDGLDYSWQWWGVDLQAVRTIKSIRIKNRTDCCHERLSNLLLEVSMKDPSSLSGYPGPTNSPLCLTFTEPVPIPGPVGYTCDEPVTGRYVRLVRPHLSIEAITICEIEIFETDVLTEKPNLALYKPTLQSSTMGKYPASNAVDENRNANINKGACTQTDPLDSSKKHWWMVDLQNSFMIEAVSIVTRDEFYYKLRNFYVEVSLEAPITLDGFPARTSASLCVHIVPQVPHPGSILYHCDQPVIGRYVRVVKPETQLGMSLTLCDFEVFGEKAIPPTTPLPTPRPAYWQFQYVTSQGLVEARRSITARIQILDCARQQLHNHVGGGKPTRFFQAQLSSRNCRFLQTIEEAIDSVDSNWTLYGLT